MAREIPMESCLRLVILVGAAKASVPRGAVRRLMWDLPPAVDQWTVDGDDERLLRVLADLMGEKWAPVADFESFLKILRP